MIEEILESIAEFIDEIFNSSNNEIEREDNE